MFQTPQLTIDQSDILIHRIRSERGIPLMKKILITGMSGLIGGLLHKYLKQKGEYQLSALNRRNIRDVDCFQSDLSDLESIKPAFDGKEIVVHLAAQITDEPWESIVSTNIIGTYNVFRAAQLSGVRRVVFASSGATVKGWEEIEPYNSITSGRYEEAPENWPMITHEMIRPDGTYGASKVWGETLGRYFSDRYGISILCVRIGTVYAEDRPIKSRDFSTYLSHQDVVDILHRCIEAPNELKYDVFLSSY